VPNGPYLSTHPGEFADWELGLNFMVPLGTRNGRAQTRQAILTVMRDFANLEQGLHSMVHTLAINVRDLDNNYEQYLAFKETREAARENLQVQIEEFRTRRNIYLNVLQALTDWGNAVTSEAQSLINYNVDLATLERQTGTILETHGLIFHEEDGRFPGPFTPCGPDRAYPAAAAPNGETTRYPGKDKPAENAFDLEKPDVRTPQKKEKDEEEPKGGK